jgi:hypothetical protein
VLQPILIVSLGKILPRMGPAAFRPPNGGMKAHASMLSSSIASAKSVSKIMERSVTPSSGAHGFDDLVELAQALLQQGAVAEDCAVTLHGPLHGEADCRGCGGAARPSDPVQPGDRALGRLLGKSGVALSGADRLDHPERGGPPKHDDVEERVGTEPVGDVHRDAGGFADRHQPRND